MQNLFEKIFGRQKLISPIPNDPREAGLISPIPAPKPNEGNERWMEDPATGESIPRPGFGTPRVAPTPEPLPTPSDKTRNPLWSKWQQSNPKSFEELLSGTKIASEKTGVPAGMLMDLSGLETSGGQFMNQISGGPGQGYFQFEPGQSYIPQDFNPYSATESALLAAQRIGGRNLNNWGVPGGNWGTLDNPNNSNGRMTDFYSDEELNRYMAPQYQF